MWVSLCVCMYVHICEGMWRPKEGFESPGPRLTGSCELLDMSAGKNSGFPSIRVYDFLTHRFLTRFTVPTMPPGKSMFHFCRASLFKFSFKICFLISLQNSGLPERVSIHPLLSPISIRISVPQNSPFTVLSVANSPSLLRTSSSPPLLCPF